MTPFKKWWDASEHSKAPDHHRLWQVAIDAWYAGNLDQLKGNKDDERDRIQCDDSI